MSNAVLPSGVVIRGTTDAADVAAVLAVLASRGTRHVEPAGYEKWRRGRLNALRRKGISDTAGL